MIPEGGIQNRHAQFARFRTWADRFQTPEGQLDEILQECRSLGETVIALLVRLGAMLFLEGKDCHEGVSYHDNIALGVRARRAQLVRSLEDACFLYPSILLMKFDSGNSNSEGVALKEITNTVDNLFRQSPFLDHIVKRRLHGEGQ
jgi:hypothetical protein